MARRGTTLTRTDFLQCKPGDTLRVIGGKYEGHLAIFHSVKKKWIGVTVRRLRGFQISSNNPSKDSYIPTNLAPHNLKPAPDLDIAVDKGSKQEAPARTLRPSQPPLVASPTVLRLASGPEVNQKVKILTRLIKTLGIDHADTNFVNYTLDLLLLVRSDMVRMKENKPTVIQTLTRSLGTQHGGEWIDEESSEEEEIY
jgi:hypothetical protein